MDFVPLTRTRSPTRLGKDVTCLHNSGPRLKRSDNLNDDGLSVQFESNQRPYTGHE